MLGIVFALEKWNQYTFGREVIIYTDHKPLESICCKPLDRAPKRLQGMLLRALAYDIEVCYLKGKDNFMADTLSRATLPYTGGQEDLECVNAVNHLTLPDANVQEMREHTAEDPSLQALKQTILDGWPDHRNQLPLMVKPYFNFRDEVSVQDGLIFRGERLIVRKGMRHKIKEDLHIGHIGVDGTLRRAREYLYWPQMTKEITEWIETCEVCMALLKVHNLSCHTHYLTDHGRRSVWISSVSREQSTWSQCATNPTFGNWTSSLRQLLE